MMMNHLPYLVQGLGELVVAVVWSSSFEIFSA
jgi:hypothetical protein